MIKYLNHEFIRFVISGGVNTLLTYGLYVALLLVMPYQAAYALSYVAGIALAYALNTRFVFQEKAQLKTAAQYPLVYLVQYVTSALFLYVLVDLLRLNESLSYFAVIAATVPITYWLSRVIFKRR